MAKSGLILLLFWLGLSHTLASEVLCDAGEYLNRETKICEECPANTYMNIKNHNLEQCFSCREPDTVQNEVQEYHCTRFQDTVIKCISGYFRDQDQTCKICQACFDGHEIMSCSSYYDTLCCSSSTDRADFDSEAKRWSCKPGAFTEKPQGEEKIIVTERTRVLCDKGYFYSSRENRCYECPTGMYMPATDHQYQMCSGCSVKEGKILKDLCTKTRDAVWVDTKEFTSTFVVGIICLITGFILCKFVSVKCLSLRI